MLDAPDTFKAFDTNVVMKDHSLMFVTIKEADERQMQSRFDALNEGFEKLSERYNELSKDAKTSNLNSQAYGAAVSIVEGQISNDKKGLKAKRDELLAQLDKNNLHTKKEALEQIFKQQDAIIVSKEEEKNMYNVIRRSNAFKSDKEPEMKYRLGIQEGKTRELEDKLPGLREVYTSQVSYDIAGKVRKQGTEQELTAEDIQRIQQAERDAVQAGRKIDKVDKNAGLKEVLDYKKFHLKRTEDQIAGLNNKLASAPETSTKNERGKDQIQAELKALDKKKVEFEKEIKSLEKSIRIREAVKAAPAAVASALGNVAQSAKSLVSGISIPKFGKSDKRTEKQTPVQHGSKEVIGEAEYMSQNVKRALEQQNLNKVKKQGTLDDLGSHKKDHKVDHDRRKSLGDIPSQAFTREKSRSTSSTPFNSARTSISSTDNSSKSRSNSISAASSTDNSSRSRSNSWVEKDAPRPFSEMIEKQKGQTPPPLPTNRPNMPEMPKEKFGMQMKEETVNVEQTRRTPPPLPASFQQKTGKTTPPPIPAHFQQQTGKVTPPPLPARPVKNREESPNRKIADILMKGKQNPGDRSPKGTEGQSL